ncbi:MAG: hypothetical protein ACD_73C00773G0009 [uncultured bacterium]|nr:MAG: hypothetical protein ACD_73C00773G0009 [uncultured bacterium]
MNFETWFTDLHPHIPVQSAQAVLKLAGEGGTIPFIARYRKEQTGNLDEVGIQSVIDAFEKWEMILQRQKFILEEIERQGKLTPELKEKIGTTFQLEALEDIYLPYKKKRKTKAQIAKEAGLESLAQWIWDCGHGIIPEANWQALEVYAATFINVENKIMDAANAIAGAQDILTERLSEMQDLRQFVRAQTFEKGFVHVAKNDQSKPNSKFENYFNFHESVASLSKPQNSHRYLALRRGWTEEELVVTIGGKLDANGGDSGFLDLLLKAFETAACSVQNSPGEAVLLKAARLALKVYVMVSIDGEVHAALKEIADEAAIKVFAENVRKLLLASPFGSKAVLGVDPGIRTGCKLAIIDDLGKYLGTAVLYLQTEAERKQSKELLSKLLAKIALKAIAVGNGTAGRETETFLRDALKELGHSQVPVVMVNESGASIYSASELAREEFPDLDLTVRGAISIARRLQDPLAELVKTDPKSIGVGQYQHDVNQTALKKSLALVVDSCVNQVGVNLNTASTHLLAHVSGIGPTLAKSIVECRSKKGLFKSREELLGISRFSPKVFEQAAGFLRIPDAKNPLDNTGVHPERYSLLENLANRLGKTLNDLTGAGVQLIRNNQDFKKQVGDFTYSDILRELEKPGRDPRENFVAFHFREDIHEVSDLKAGMLCNGIVTNVTNFGAFVDIGVHQDGLVHISQLANHFVKDPRDVVSAGDRLQVRVLEVNLEKRQIALTLRLEEKVVANNDIRAEKPSAKKPAIQNHSKSIAHNPFAVLAGMRKGN